MSELQLQRESLRNVAMISSAGAGKTSLAEAMLFTAGAVPHLGSIAQGTTVSDFEPEELHRRSSVSTSLLRCSWNAVSIYHNVVSAPAMGGPNRLNYRPFVHRKIRP